MRRIVRGVLWVVKGVLLAIALAALVLWPFSYGHGASIWVLRFTPRLEKVEGHGFYAACWSGRIGAAEWNWDYSGESLGDGREKVAAYGTHWQWKVDSKGQGFFTKSLPHSWGPLWRGFGGSNLWGQWIAMSSASLPCWLVVVSTAAWPLTSLTLLHRRRARRLRLARAGCCTQCGYDLRATPHAGGELVTRCPECGTATRPARDG